METRTTKVKAFARSFLTTNALTDATVYAYELDAVDKNKINPVPIKTLITDKNGDIEFDWPINKPVTLRIEKPGYHAIQSGIIPVPPEGINDPDRVKNISFQVPSSFLGVKGFAYAMHGKLTDDGKAQAVVATVAELGMTMDDLPQGCVGATAKLVFHDAKLQAQWEALLKRDPSTKKYKERLYATTNVVTAVSALAAYYHTRNLIKTLLTAVATKTITATIAWKYLNRAIHVFYFDVCKVWPLTNKTNPFERSLISVSPDGGVIFNLRDLELPLDGAKFTMKVTGPNGVLVSDGEGFAFPGILTNLSPDGRGLTCPMSLTVPNPSGRLMYGSGIETLAKMVACGGSTAYGMYKLLQHTELTAEHKKMLIAGAGALSAKLALSYSCNQAKKQLIQKPTEENLVKAATVKESEEIYVAGADEKFKQTLQQNGLFTASDNPESKQVSDSKCDVRPSV